MCIFNNPCFVVVLTLFVVAVSLPSFCRIFAVSDRQMSGILLQFDSILSLILLVYQVYHYFNHSVFFFCAAFGNHKG